MMQKGSSIKWTKVLEDLTDGRSSQLDPLPMLEYFKPLHKWLLRQDLKLTDYDCDKYLDVKKNRVRSYDEEFFLPNNIEYFEVNSANNNKFCLILFSFSLKFIFLSQILEL